MTMTLIDRIEQAMASDDEDREKQSRHLVAAYERAKAAGHPTALGALNDAFIALCGYSLTTLLEEKVEPTIWALPPEPQDSAPDEPDPTPTGHVAPDETIDGLVRRIEQVVALNRRDGSCVIPRALLMEIRARLLWESATPQKPVAPSDTELVEMMRLHLAVGTALTPESPQYSDWADLGGLLSRISRAESAGLPHSEGVSNG